MRVKRSFLYKKTKRVGLAVLLCLCAVSLVYGGLKIFAEMLDNDVRVNEDDILTYYLSVNSDGIDHTGVESSDAKKVEESSGITKVTDVLPDGLIFEGFVTTEDGSFGAVSRDGQFTACSGKVIDDTNEESVDAGVWNDDETEYTYHGLHYDVASHTVTFRTKEIGAGCELTVGIIVRTPTLKTFQTRMDFYNTATFIDESIADKSNTVHAYIEKATPPEPLSVPTPKPDSSYYSISYRYDGDVPADAPDLPAMEWYYRGDAFEMADKPVVECYAFDGWNWQASSSSAVDTDPYATFGGVMPSVDVVFFGSFTKTCQDDPEGDPSNPTIVTPDKYNVSYEVLGERPDGFEVPAMRSYYEGASVELDSTKVGENIDGYSFSGWETSDAAVENSSFTMPNNDVVIRGSFEREKYTVSYEFYGDVIPENAQALLPASVEYYAGDLVTIADVVTADGYEFSGWMADPTFEMPAEDVVIYGNWAKNRAEYTPEISIAITNPKEKFYLNETVEFAITVKNNQEFDLSNVWLEELLEGVIFVPGEGYTISEASFARIDYIPVGGQAIVKAEYVITKNADKVYQNIVELISADSADENYSLPNEWNNRASVDFVSGVTEGVPEDADDDIVPEEKKNNPVTFDGFVKSVSSISIMGGGLLASIFVFRRFRRSGVVYGYVVAIMTASGLAVVLLNGGHIFADVIELRPELDIYSERANFGAGDLGSWKVHESGLWTGVGEATLNVRVDTVHITNLHQKDVVLILDNGVWTKNGVDGTPIDSDGEKTSLELMKEGAVEFARRLLEDGDSRLVVFPTWGDSSSALTDDIDEAIAQIESIESTNNISNGNYSTSYDRVISFLDFYDASDDRALNIVYVADDHFASSSDIAKYKILKAKAPKATVSSIGYGFKELLNERYTSDAGASDSGVVRYWLGVDGNAHAIGWYTHAVGGLEKISDWHDNPFAKEYVASLVRSVDTSTMYNKFDLGINVNTTDFDIKAIYSNVGDINVEGGLISWINEEDNGFVSGANYSMSIVLQTKDETVEKHKLYELTTSTSIESDSGDIEAENVTENAGVVLMNGYEVTFSANNAGTCSLGDNATKVYLAYQKIALDTSGVSCEGWNFDTFRDSDGTIYSLRNNTMPADDLNLLATWRKTSVTKRMDGQVYVAAPAILKEGDKFNETLSSIMSSPLYSTILLKSEDSCPREIMDRAHRISDDNSPTPVYAYVVRGDQFTYNSPYDGSEGWYYSNITYYCTEADTIKLNEDSAKMFANTYYYDEQYNYHSLQNRITTFDDSVADWDASGVKNMDSMFASGGIGAWSLQKLSSWDVSNVESMNNTFAGVSLSTDYANGEAFADWDTSNVKSMKETFANTNRVTETLGIGNWDVSNVEDMEGIFENATLEDISSISSWNTTGVKNLDYAFYGTKRPSPNASLPIDTSPLASWDVSNVDTMNYIFYSTSGTDGADFGGLANWNMANVKELSYAFASDKMPDLGVFSNWNLSSLEDMSYIFYGSKLNYGAENADTLEGIEDWDVSNVKNMSNAFASTKVSDLSALADWDVSSVEDMTSIFSSDQLTNLTGLEDWDVSSVTTLAGAFYENNQLTDLDALKDWDVSSVELLNNTFQGISADNLLALKDWDTSSLTSLGYTFCGAYQTYVVNGYTQGFSCSNTTAMKNGTTVERTPYGGVRSLEGIENWDTSKVTNMNAMIAGGSVTDLTPIAGWDDSSLETLDYTFARTNLVSLEPLMAWDTPNLLSIQSTFEGSYKIKNLDGIDNFNVSKVREMRYTFQSMYGLENISALMDWDTESLQNLFYTFTDHKKLTSLDGLQNWDVSNVEYLSETFMGYSRYTWGYYTNWSQYCSSSLTDISALAGWTDLSSLRSMQATFACNNRLVDLTPLRPWRVGSADHFRRIFEGDSSVTTLDGLQDWFSVSVSGGFIDFDYAFMNMSSLRDTSALSNWVDPEERANFNIDSIFRNDRQITSLAPLENCMFKNNYYKPNAFDNIPSSVARPSWY